MRIYQTMTAGLALAFAPADMARAAGHSPETVAEIVTFTLNDGVDETAFVEATKGTEAFVSTAPGFISRQLSRGQNGIWTDYVLWSDLASAQAAGAAVMAEPGFAQFIGAIDPNSVKMRHEPVIWSMGQ